MVVRPLAPRAGEERGVDPRDGERGHLVRRGDTRPAVGGDGLTRAYAHGGEALAERIGVEESPLGADAAPGMCPARGSIGSTSPRYRSTARASSSTPRAPNVAAPSMSIRGM